MGDSSVENFRNTACFVLPIITVALSNRSLQGNQKYPE